MKIVSTLLLACFALAALTAQNIPIDFESDGNGADWTWTVFENDDNPPLEIIDNPDPSGLNTSATVAKFTALQAGQPFAGCESMRGADIGTFVITEDNSTIRIMVWKPVISDVGIKLVRDDGFSLGEIKIPNTVTNEWEQLTFDFSGQLGNTYNQIVIFPDFAERSADNVIYFDNVYGEAASPNSIPELGTANLSLYPNPAGDYLTLDSEETLNAYRIYAMTGQLVAENELPGVRPRIDIRQFPAGLYLLRASVDGQILVRRFVKE